jgi:SynChlorMet cassette radical SAM/SPASM protein ScmF
MTLCEPVESGTAAEEEHHGLDLPEGVPPLTSFYLYLTTGCNLACRHCWITPTFVNGEPDPGHYLEIDLLKEAVEEAKPLGLCQVKLTGGEPTLHPHFVELVDMLTAQKLQIDMETNGTLIDSALARYLREKANLRFMSISIDGACAETHDRFRGVPGAFEAALEGLKHLVNVGYGNVQVIMSLYRGNISELEQVVRLAIEHGAGSLKFNPVMCSGRGVGMHERGEALDFGEVMALTRHIYGELQTFAAIPLKIMLPPALLTVRELLQIGDGGGACHVRYIMGLLGTGEMALCGIGRNVPELCFGHLGQDSVREVWLSDPVLQELRQNLEGPYPGICGDCIHAPRCLTHCVAQNYLDSGHLVWPSSLCAEADRRGVFPISRRRSGEKRLGVSNASA